MAQKRQKYGRRRLYPMPVEALVDHPEFIAMPAAARGILISLLLHFWLTECRPLPISDRELRSIGRAHVPTWKHWGESVLRVFEAVKPALAAYHRLREAHGTTLSFGAQKANSNRALKAIRDQATPNQPIPAYALGALPKADSRLPAKRKPSSDNNRLTDRPHA